MDPLGTLIYHMATGEQIISKGYDGRDENGRNITDDMWTKLTPEKREEYDRASYKTLEKLGQEGIDREIEENMPSELKEIVKGCL